MSAEEIIFFVTAREWRKWLQQNHSKKTEQWIGFYKGKKETLTVTQAFEQALCFGWSVGNVRRIDYFTYKMRFIKRKHKGVWGKNAIAAVKRLKRQGKMHASGWQAFLDRSKKVAAEPPEKFSAKTLREFRANKKAWAFFNSQTPGYQKYMKQWVESAKREETRSKRLAELIRDSAAETKLKRILAAQEKYERNRFPEGKTPVEEGRNLGPVLGGELRSVGIDTLEKLKDLGWEEAFNKLIESYPERASLNMACALIGAVNDQNWRKVDSHEKQHARSLIYELTRR